MEGEPLFKALLSSWMYGASITILSSFRTQTGSLVGSFSRSVMQVLPVTRIRFTTAMNLAAGFVLGIISGDVSSFQLRLSYSGLLTSLLPKTVPEAHYEAAPSEDYWWMNLFSWSRVQTNLSFCDYLLPDQGSSKLQLPNQHFGLKARNIKPRTSIGWVRKLTL